MISEDMRERQETEDGLEKIMATNHFGHFLLTNLLILHIKRTAEEAFATQSPVPRIVVVSSKLHAANWLLPNVRIDIDENGDDINVQP